MDYLFMKYIEPRKDFRIEKLFMMQGPSMMMSSIVMYLVVNLYVLPNMMKNRKPYNLKNVMRIYNVSQILGNLLMSVNLIRIYFSLKFAPFGCYDVNRSSSGDHNALMWWMWLYFITRVVDMIETSFFYLRKKNDQASFLHYYHHVAAVFVTWVGIKMVPGGSFAFPIIVNTIVHVVMYTYYLAAAEAGPESKKRLQKYKKMITKMQLTQFVIILIHSGRLLMPSCEIPKLIFVFHIPNVAINLVLFVQFFKSTYSGKKETSKI